MNKKHFLIAAIASVFLLTVISIPSSSQLQKKSETQLFPENMILEGALFTSGNEYFTEYRRDLIGLDEYTCYPPSSRPDVVPKDRSSYIFLWNSEMLTFNETYVHQKIWLEPYRILGIPSVYIRFNMTNDWWSSYATTYVKFQAHLGIVFMDGQWNDVAFIGNDTWEFTQEYWGTASSPEFQGTAILTNRNNIPLDTWIDPYTRLAIRIQIYVWKSYGDVSYWSLTMPYRRNEHDFIVEIPIVTNP